ncbi:MAG: signal peptidase I [Planctomycetes bacterium]|nr:signal peptidase I [Planctomycetota bacterium]
MNTEVFPVRKPWIAKSLSMICTGLGQIYCGRVERGLMMFCGSLLLGPVLIVTALIPNSTAMLVTFLISLAGLIGLVVWSVRDAGRIARSLTEASPPQVTFRPLVYILMTSTSIPYAIGLAFFLRATVLEAFIVPSASMSPTLVPGDRILVTKLGLSEHKFERGNVVVFRYPINHRQNYVKRIVGLPGETIEIKDGKVIINGKPLEQTPIPPEGKNNTDSGQAFLERAGDREYTIRMDQPDSGIQLKPQVVAPDAYFVLGDNRTRSRDSREFGSVPHGLMVGVVRYIYLPGDKWNRFGVTR